MDKGLFKTVVLGSAVLQPVILIAILALQISDSSSDETYLPVNNDIAGSVAPTTTEQITGDFNKRLELLITDTLAKEIEQLKNELPQDHEHLESVAGFDNHDPAPDLKEPSHGQQIIEQTANAESQEIVSQALINGVWTAEDTKLISQYVPDLSDQQRRVLLDRFVNALNRQEIELKDIPNF